MIRDDAIRIDLGPTELEFCRREAARNINRALERNAESKIDRRTLHDELIGVLAENVAHIATGMSWWGYRTGRRRQHQDVGAFGVRGVDDERKRLIYRPATDDPATPYMLVVVTYDVGRRYAIGWIQGAIFGRDVPDCGEFIDQGNYGKAWFVEADDLSTSPGACCGAVQDARA